MEQGSASGALTRSAIVARHLTNRNVQEYIRLSELRRQGWEAPRGDAHFNDQKRRADQADKDNDAFWYSMMQKIGQDMHKQTSLKIEGDEPQILDFCAAPGGFLRKVMKINPKAHARAFSLPPESSGHHFRLPMSDRFSCEYLDITMLAEDMGATSVSEQHPDVKNFLSRRLQDSERFDLILCDGKVLENHQRAPYRARCEARRLVCTQLSLGLQHIKKGGTMVVLLHKLEAWDTLATVVRFSRFSSIHSFKPTRCHAIKSSLYLVAKNIVPDGPDAKEAMRVWKKMWMSSTFPQDEPATMQSVSDDLDVNLVLAQFGEQLIELGRPIWSRQSEALAHAPFMRR